MHDAVKILIIEDDVVQRTVLERMLFKQGGYGVIAVDNGADGLQMIADREDISLVIVDLGLPDMHGQEVIRQAKQKRAELPLIVLTGSDDVGDAVQAMQAGAADFLTKPPEFERLSVSIRNALKIHSLSEEVSRLRRKDSGVVHFADMIGHDGGLATMVGIGKKAAQADIPVLISGETGVGKELFARAIHGESKRCDRPFIAVNCGAIPKELVESTLFGHEKGAFTGAVSKALGKFREAEGGTLFLDEVGELPMEAQVKLLRVLQQKEVEPVGAGATVPVHVRVVSATNRHLPLEVREGRFREDLYFRLDGLPLHVPPLRERVQDIPALARYFLAQFSQQEGLPECYCSEGAIAWLQAQEWPGNVRQLRNVLYRAAVLSERAELSEVHLTQVLASGVAGSVAQEGGRIGSVDIAFMKQPGVFFTLEEVEQQAVETALEYYGGNIAKAAKALGVAKSTFYRKWGELAGHFVRD